MKALLACIRKEMLLLSRDVHALMLLFVMPLAFVLIMSLALQNQFAARAGTQLKVLVLDAEHSVASRALRAGLNAGGAFEFFTSPTVPTAAQLQQLLQRGKYAFALQIPLDFSSRLRGTDDSALLDIQVAPDTGKQIETIFVGNVQAVLGQLRIGTLLSIAVPDGPPRVVVHYAYANTTAAPSSVQQSVPAWLVFGAFFVVVPLSNTFIHERQQGTLRRLRSTHLGSLRLLLGKLIPYFIINQLQVVTMLLAGRYLVPLLGGDTLQLPQAGALMALIAAALSICALGLALLIAVTAKTTEQASLLGGTGNIVLAALGGIMIPKFVMPTTLQNISAWSPMSWGLEGFLDVLLRNGSLRDVAPQAAGLTALGLAAILLAWFIQSRREH